MYQFFNKGFSKEGIMQTMTSKNSLACLAIIATSTMVCQFSHAAVNELTNISSVVGQNQTELRLKFNGTPVMPKAYQITDPDRLVLDLSGTKNKLNERYKAFHTPEVTSVTAIDNQELTRLVIALKKQSDFSTRVDGDTLVLKVANNAQPTYTNSSIKPVTVNTNAYSASKPIVSNNSINVGQSNPLLDPRTAEINSQKYNFYGLRRINFSRSEGNTGKVDFSLENANVPIDVQRKGSKIVVRMLGAKVPKNLRRRMNVSSYNTPVKNVDAFNDGNNGTIIIQPKGEFDYQVYQADSRLTVEVQPIVRVRDPRPKQKTYSGQPLSMDFQDVEVRAVLDLIADFTNINLVASDSVSGRMTLKLQNVPWDQALDIILKSKGLDKRQNGNVIMVAPAADLVAQEKKEIEAKNAFKELAPVRTEYIQLNYAKASDMESLISEAKNSTSGKNDATSLLSERGSVTIDDRTNTLIIQDTSDKIDEIRGLISKLDVPVKQVMIEARIVRATDSFSKELGVKWGLLSQGTATNNSLLVGGSDQTIWDLKDFERDTTDGSVTYNIERPSNLNVDLGVTSTGASRIAFGLLEISDFTLDLELSALQADGKGEVVSTPKVLTTDKQKAIVASGTQIPYEQATSSGATAISFINAELSLEVTPSITPDGRVAMELKVNSDTPGEVQANGIRAIDTNRVDTNVLVDDGQTVVLGGIFQNQTTNSVTKTPFLGDLPYVGRMFRKTVNSNNKQELLIFVTPRLVNENVSNVSR